MKKILKTILVVSLVVLSTQGMLFADEVLYFGSDPAVSNSETYYFGSDPAVSNSGTYYFGSDPAVSNSETYYFGSDPAVSNSGSVGYSTVGYSTVGYGTTGNYGYTTGGYTTGGYTTGGYTYGGSSYGNGYTYGGYGYGNGYVFPGVTNTTTCPSGSTWNGSSCVVTTIGTTTNLTVCPNGTIASSTPTGTVCINNVNGPVITNINCPSGTTLTNGQCINNTTGPVINNVICPSGTTLTNGQCVNNITGSVVTNITCPSGSVLTNGQCVNNITGTVVTNVVCPSGTVVSGNTCVSTVNPSVVVNQTCPTGTYYVNGACQQNIYNPVVTYQTCWDGSVIPTTSVCSPQYKVCSNGISIPINQTCPVPTTPIFAPTKIAFNNVVTSLATEVTHTQGRCNGIGLIAQGAQSTGWFEYGETANLGRTTASANIGSLDTAPFSNLLTNLKPSTKYYCRAVMQNKYGTVKGEVVSFTTKSKPTTYVKPVAATPTKTTTKVTPKNEVVCSDGTTISVKNQSAATLLTEGQKLVTLNIEKTEGKIASEGIVKYKVSFKNISDSRLKDVVIKVRLPEEIRLLDTNAGLYDAVTRTITLNQSSLDPYTEGTILFSGVVAKDAALGKTIVTNAYVAYTVPGTNAQDEVTAYVIGSVVPVGDTGTAKTGEKKVIGAGEGKGFLPNSLIEWLALLAILFIIFILGRSIYASYKEGDGAHH